MSCSNAAMSNQEVIATKDQLKPGVRVRCNLKYNAFRGKSATVHHWTHNVLWNVLWLVWDSNLVDVREWGSFVEGDFVLVQDQPTINVNSQVVSSSGVAVNNHTCKSCGNNRCNVSEKSCWKCGNLL